MVKSKWNDVGLQIGAWGAGLLVGVPLIGIFVGALWWMCLAIWRSIAGLVFM